MKKEKGEEPYAKTQIAFFNKVKEKSPLSRERNAHPDVRCKWNIKETGPEKKYSTACNRQNIKQLKQEKDIEN